MVRTGHGPNDWQDEGAGSARTSSGISGSMVIGARGESAGYAATRRWRNANERNREAENEARRRSRAAKRAAAA